MPSASSPVTKSARKSAPGRPFTKGDARSGRGPKKGAANAGRPPDAIRATCRKGFDERIALLNAIADDTTKDDSVRLKAIEMLAKYGLGSTITPTDTDGKTLGGGVLVVPGTARDAAAWQAQVRARQAVLTARPGVTPPSPE